MGFWLTIGGIYAILVFLCYTAPLWVRILLFALNLVVPDPIPIVDDVLMGVGVISKILGISRILWFFNKFKWIILIAIIGIVIFVFAR